MSWVISGIWNGLAEAIGNALSYIGKALQDALMWLVNSILGAIESALNWIRNYIPYVITILISWYGISNIVMNPNLDLRKKFIGSIGSIGLGLLAGFLFDALVPKAVQLPRWIRYAPEQMLEEEYQTQYIEENVTLVETVAPIEEVYQNQYADSYVKIIEMVAVTEEIYQPQYTYESVTIG